jgi:hypothetical protein
MSLELCSVGASFDDSGVVFDLDGRGGTRLASWTPAGLLEAEPTPGNFHSRRFNIFKGGFNRPQSLKRRKLWFCLKVLLAC